MRILLSTYSNPSAAERVACGTRETHVVLLYFLAFLQDADAGVETVRETLVVQNLASTGDHLLLDELLGFPVEPERVMAQLRDGLVACKGRNLELLVFP